MSIKTFKPTTPSRRQMTVSGFDGIDKKAKPEPSLTEPLKKSSGRNSYGRITVRHRGGGNKRKYRIIDFKRDKHDMFATVLRLEYDPNRSANIALLEYEDGERRYILAPVGLNAGDKVESGAKADIKVGNAPAHRQHPRGHRDPQHRAAPRQRRPAGALRRHRRPADGQGGQRRPDPHALRRGPHRAHQLHGHHRPGGNIEHENINIGKAGRKRHMGWRPTVRGSVMNPNDHPHGGGEGRAPVGRPGPVTPWGKPAMGYKTRKGKNPTNKFIVKRRNEK